MKRGLLLLLCLAPQFLVVGALAAREERALHQGVEVRLAVRPVDPMTLFSGRYVSVPLAIERLDFHTTRLEEGLSPGLEWDEDVYVRLEQADPVWRAVEVTRRPPSAPGAVFLRGTWTRDSTIEYGLDTFYIPADGADPSGRSLSVLVRLSSHGEGRITDLLVDGQPYAQWNAAHKAR